MAKYEFEGTIREVRGSPGSQEPQTEHSGAKVASDVATGAAVALGVLGLVFPPAFIGSMACAAVADSIDNSMKK